MPKLSMILDQVGKTINLAKSNTYQIPRKPPMNTLIFEKLPEPRCGDKVTCGIKGPPITKPVRVCTKEDMQAFYCPPVPCDCKIKPPPLTFSQKVVKTTILLIKSLIVGGLVYYTWSEGLWSDTEHTAIIYDKLTGLLLKETMKAMMVGGIAYYTYKEGLWSDGFRSSCFLGKYVERCPPEDDDSLSANEFADLTKITLEDPEPCYPFIPHSGYLLYKTGYFWNQIIIYAFWFFLDMPGEALEALINFLYPPPKPKPPRECPS